MTVKPLDECIVESLDSPDKELLPFIPYILQDLWEFGSDPETIILLVRKHTCNYQNLRILDPGCGKGAVSIKLAAEFKCSCVGIDAMKEFIGNAELKAKEWGVEKLCRFIHGDIRKEIQAQEPFDVIILGSIGPVLGDAFTALIHLSSLLKNNGIIILDEGYLEDTCNIHHPGVLKRAEILGQISRAGMKLMDEVVMDKKSIKDSDQFIFHNIRNRCMELMAEYPEKSTIFENYIKKQEEENHLLETLIICSTMVMAKSG